MPRYFPLVVDMAGLRCLVAGGGRIGTRKAINLAAAGADVTVVDQEVSPRLRRQVEQGQVRWHRARYDASMLDGFSLVVAASFPRSDSLVILMGVGVLRQIVGRLLADGWGPDTPAAVIERGTLRWERRVTGPLGQLERLASEAGMASPALIVVGVAAKVLGSLERRPTILFTGRDPTGFRQLGPYSAS